MSAEPVGEATWLAPLDATAIRAALPSSVLPSLATLCVLDETDSTNDRVRDESPANIAALNVVLAEYQSAGRGRRGRSWQSPRGRGLCLSIGWHADDAEQPSPLLSLSAGLAARGALARWCGDELALKWPNDVLFRDQKLAGLLIESENLRGVGYRIIVGIGVNIDVDDAMAGQIEAEAGLRPVGLSAVAAQGAASRNVVAAALIEMTYKSLVAWNAASGRDVVSAWRHCDALAGRSVAVSTAEGVIRGTADGVNNEGQLRLRVDGEMHTFAAADVTLRQT